MCRQAYQQPLDARSDVAAEEVSLRSIRTRPSIESWGQDLGIDEDEDSAEAAESAEVDEAGT